MSLWFLAVFFSSILVWLRIYRIWAKIVLQITVVASMERFAYKGVASNLVTYLTDVVKLSTSSAAKSVSSWSGVTSMLPLISAVLVDSYWDRYSTITASSMLYVMVRFCIRPYHQFCASFSEGLVGPNLCWAQFYIFLSLEQRFTGAWSLQVDWHLFVHINFVVQGLVGLTLWAVIFSWLPTSSLFLPLYLISIGQAGYNPSLQAFGADQLDLDDDLNCSNEEDKTIKNKSPFFQWWYFGICSGSLLGNSVMSYIQDTVGWGLGFAIPTIVMMVSVMSFLSCTRFYVHNKHLNCNKPPNESIFQAVKIGLKNIVGRKPRLPPREEDAAELE